METVKDAKNRKRWIKLVPMVLIAFLVIGNPSEARFQQRLVTDYGESHSGLSLDFSDLAEMGNTNYQSYLLFSRYYYAFGSIGVRYFGIGFMTFYLGNNQTKPTRKQEKEVIS